MYTDFPVIQKFRRNYITNRMIVNTTLHNTTTNKKSRLKMKSELTRRQQLAVRKEEDEWRRCARVGHTTDRRQTEPRPPTLSPLRST